MFSTRLTIGSVLLAGVLAAVGGTAHADNINTSATACKNYNAGEALDIDFLTTGVRNLNASPRYVICPLPRSPTTTPPPTTFYIDGTNQPGTTTWCTVTVYSYQGTVVATQSFSETASTWDFGAVLNPMPSFFDYASVLCYLPGNAGGTLLGVTAVQP